MLVLSRRLDEKLIIGESGEIEITVVDIGSDKVRLGIKAPKTIPVDREEVRIRKQGEKESSLG